MNNTLSELISTIEDYHGQFFLISACCNYPAFRDRVTESLQKESSLNIRTVALKPDIRNLLNTLSEAVGKDTPDALTVSGFESLIRLEDVLIGANLSRDIFREKFPFPVVLWINDTILQKLSRIATDLASWAGIPLRFEPSDDELLEILAQNATALFDKILKPDTCLLQAEYPLSPRETEFLQFLSADLEKRQIALKPESDAALQFLKGKQAHDKGDFDSAIRCYETARAFWKGKDREREGVLLYFIAKSYEGKNDPKTALSFFRECIKAFAGNAELKTRCMLDLCGLLKTSGDCKKLETLAENALQLAQTCGNDGASASCRLFFAENALSRSDQDRAEKEMQVVLDIVFPDAGLELTQADEVLDYLKNFLESREDAGEKIPVKSNPKIYIRILDALHDIYVARRQYLQAFQAKQAKYSLEQQFGFRAFIGAVRLKPSRMARLGDFPVTEEIEASGRKEDIEKLIDRLGDQHCRVIVFHGNSGVGKSSVLEAGLEPKLKNDVVGNYNRAAPILIRSYGDWSGEMLRVLKAFNASRGAGVGCDQRRRDRRVQGAFRFCRECSFQPGRHTRRLGLLGSNGAGVGCEQRHRNRRIQGAFRFCQQCSFQPGRYTHRFWVW